MSSLARVIYASEHNISINHLPTRELTPSTPRPQFGQPKPQATVAGVAKGEAAEKYVIGRVGTGGSSEGAGGMRFCVDRNVFSGMLRKEGIAYLIV